MADSEHGRIIASQAKIALQPAGFRRNGRSRVWIADRGFWLSVVEFQPSSWSKGTYLNVAVHWLGARYRKQLPSIALSALESSFRSRARHSFCSQLIKWPRRQSKSIKFTDRCSLLCGRQRQSL
ncbi:DUF4304 domain-containing protein [Mesorhizobium sp. M1C.F.Ca.ET.193.01.1.1]|nr:DUF4304 domain-containing protein [Mesorhizobium sp. M1C.F.Ca.ET.210.01.1.1]TGQ71670.1 DUF4304 domain-containing protein [Mesorhizobium sp. M1C.F.Ca.ET.212.01.1.1]TGR08411.1 DUF4304 domain-containing protein [Mesorhizobium sp. M1C.F.Ca.ET.204.01.1.1]TGR28652.1 DUF4304 domain-containing protein [Mesorhizobium sp. M1C.F.Ca.ET.196.01.1.1]TGR51175.1 DUF4304 domain-containing protein [Mesorhizobium sp. M1C.F.Ca.ET.195.01.1.1]TGR65335.1 DUF4304 domain-containing protein [Mesorhizobium sp. M1C.F.C